MPRVSLQCSHFQSRHCCHCWNGLAAVIPASPSFSSCQTGERVGKSPELKWWLMTRLLRCTLPCWHALTVLHFSALIGQPCKLSALRMWAPGLSQPPTQQSVWATLLWLNIAHRKHTVGLFTVYCTFARYCAMIVTEEKYLWVYIWNRWSIWTGSWKCIHPKPQVCLTYRNMTMMNHFYEFLTHIL